MSIAGSSLAVGSANASVSALWSNQSAHGAQRLWCAVLEEQVHDLFDLRASYKPNRPPLVIKSRACELAEAWVGNYPSRNFSTVCELAGLDSDAVHGRLKRLLSVPDQIRADHSYMAVSKQADQLWADIKAAELEAQRGPAQDQEAA